VTRLSGRGLHGGRDARVVLLAQARPGPTELNGTDVRELVALRAERATAVRVRGERLSTVEHLFSALAGLGLHEGVAIDVSGPELPLLDGCARRYCEALRPLAIAKSEPMLEVKKKGVVELGPCRYELEPADAVRVEVRAVFDDARLEAFASWDGDAEDYEARVAPARTFAFAHEIEHLLARGLASHVEPESVVVVAEDGLLSAGEPAAWDEPVRHKLLDLVGDLFLYGGPPRGVVRALRPGHYVTHEAMRSALAQGLVGLRA
jgi:UDP-3-O-acyl-N-acetylglucosamine deacetylase